MSAFVGAAPHRPSAPAGSPEADLEFLLALSRAGLSVESAAELLQAIEDYDEGGLRVLAFDHALAVIFPETWPAPTEGLIGYFCGCGVCLVSPLANVA